MKYNMNCRLYGFFYHSACKKELKKKGITNKTIRNIESEYKKIVFRAKDIGKNRMLSAYMMGAYYIALNRGTGLSARKITRFSKIVYMLQNYFTKQWATQMLILTKRSFPAERSGLRKVISENMKTTG